MIHSQLASLIISTDSDTDGLRLKHSSVCKTCMWLIEIFLLKVFGLFQILQLLKALKLD